MLCEKLNSAITKNLSSPLFGAKNPEIKFYTLDAFGKIKELVKSISPCGKIAFVTTLNNNLKYCTKLAKTIKSVNSSMVTVVVDEDDLSIEGVSELFALPDDVRGVMITEAKLSDLVLYYANLKKLPLIIIPTDCDLNGILKNRVSIMTGDKLDLVSVKVSRHVVLDDEFLGKDIHNLYASIMSRLVSLIDYRINHVVFGGQISKKAFELVKQSVLSTFNVLKLSDENKRDVLLYNALAIEMASSITKGEIDLVSAQNVSSVLNRTKNLPHNILYASLKILRIYKLLSGISLPLDALTDLNALADEMASATGISSGMFLQNLIKQTKSINKFLEKAQDYMGTITTEINSFVKFSDKIIETYLALGGKTDENDDLSFSILHAGDYLYGGNGMTLARESGLLRKV